MKRHLTVKDWFGTTGFDLNDDETGKCLGMVEMVYFADTEGTCWAIYNLNGEELHKSEMSYAKTKRGAAWAIVNALNILDAEIKW